MRIREEFFTVDGVPAVRWIPDDDTTDPRPLILIGHGGGQHKTAPDVLHRAHHFVADGFAAVSVDVPNHGDRPADDQTGGLPSQRIRATSTAPPTDWRVPDGQLRR